MITVTKENMEAIREAAKDDVTVEEVAAYLNAADGGYISEVLGDNGEIATAVENKSDGDTAYDIAMMLYADYIQDLAISEWEKAFEHFNREGDSD